jgi:hypothetical protein
MQDSLSHFPISLDGRDHQRAIRCSKRFFQIKELRIGKTTIAFGVAGEDDDLEAVSGFVEDGGDVGELVSGIAPTLGIGVLSCEGFVQGIGGKIGAVGPADDAKLVDACLCEEFCVFERFEDGAK